MADTQDWTSRLFRSDAGQFVTQVVNYLTYALRRFFGERMTNAVASLTYSTLLAIVPLLVIAFAILSSFQAFNAAKERMQTAFFEAVVPEAGAAIGDYLSSFTQNANNLTAVGIVALAVTAVLLLSTIEDTFNRIWRVERPRPMAVRLLIFWAVLTMGPLVIGASFAVSSDALDYLRQVERAALGEASELVDNSTKGLRTVLGLAISIFGMTALYTLVPARRVRPQHALIGAVFAVLGFQALGWGFNTFMGSGSSYQTIYGAVAAVPLFLVWVYFSWMVIIMGAVLAAAFPDWWKSRDAALGVALGPTERLEVALEILARFQSEAHRGGARNEEDILGDTPFEGRDALLEALSAAGYLVTTEDLRLALARDLHETTVADLAHDLGLTVGRAINVPSTVPAGVLDGFAYDVGALHRGLDVLSTSETSSLDMPIASLVRPPARATSRAA